MRITLLLCFLILSICGNAQVKEGSYDLSLGEQYGYMMDHHKADKKVVEDVVEETIKQYGKVKRNRKAKEWYCEECNISMVSNDPVTVYYKVEEGRDLVTTYLFVDDGTKFLSSYNDQEAARQIEKINMEIYYEVEREMLRKEIEDLEDKLGDYDKDLTKLIKKNEDLHEDIEDYKEKIRQAEKDIEQNLQDQEDKRIEIEMQKKVINKVTDKLNQVGRK